MKRTKILTVSIAIMMLSSVAFAQTANKKAAPWTVKSSQKEPLSYPKGNGVRMVSTGHSWVAPALRTLPKIAAAAGFDSHRQRKHIRGGGNGAANAIWCREVGLSGNENPILIPAIETGNWDIMTWGVFTNDRTEYFEEWIELCLKHNPNMEFFLQDAWTGTLRHKSENKLNLNIFQQAQTGINTRVSEVIKPLREKYPGKVHVIPVGDAMLEMLKLYYDNKLPGIEGLSSHLCGKKHALWSDGGHLGKYMNWWEGYCYYATIYKKSPELIDASFEVTEYNKQLDKMMRKCAWTAVTNHPLSGVTDKNDNGIADQIEKTARKKQQ